MTNLNHWGAGYQVDVAVTNSGTEPVNGWTIALDFGEDPQLSGGWNVDLSASGNIVTASNISWNGNLSAGQSISFGFQGGSDGSMNTPVCTSVQ